MDSHLIQRNIGQPAVFHLRTEEGTVLDSVGAGQQRGDDLIGLILREEAEAAEIDTEDRHAGVSDDACRGQESAVAAEAQEGVGVRKDVLCGPDVV